MSNIDSGRLITHIDEAKSWLDKAKEEYSESNSIRGDLHLNLAQAEMKYAWELSRQTNVSMMRDSLPAVRPKWQRRHLLPAAAALIAIMTFGFVGFHFLQTSETRDNAIAIRAVPTETVTPAPVERNLPTVAVKENATKNAPDSQKSRPAPTVARKQAPVIAEAPKTPVAQLPEEKLLAEKEEPAEVVLDMIKTTPVNASDVQSTTSKETIVANTSRDVRAESYANTVKLQPAASMIIDEEALTKEASRSLRFGK